MSNKLKQQIINASIIPIAMLLGFLFGVFAVENTIMNNMEHSRAQYLLYYGDLIEVNNKKD